MGATVGRRLPVALVSAVGERILADLPRVPPADLEAAQGVLATGRSISVVVPEDRAVRTLRAFHRAFVESPRAAARTERTPAFPLRESVPAEAGATTRG